MDNWDEFKPVGTPTDGWDEFAPVPEEKAREPFQKFMASTEGGMQGDFDVEATGVMPNITADDWRAETTREMMALRAREVGAADRSIAREDAAASDAQRQIQQQQGSFADELRQRAAPLNQTFTARLNREIEAYRATPEMQAKLAASKTGEFTRGFERGALGGGEMIGSTLQQVGESLEKRGQPNRLKGIGQAIQYVLATERANVPDPRVGTMGDVNWEIGKFGDWFWNKLGEGLGSTTTMMAGGAVGGWTGAGLTLWGISVGEMRQELEEAGITDPDLMEKYTYIGGSAIAALDSIVPAGVAKSMTGNVKREISRYMIRRVTAGMLKGAGKEGVTEALQESVQIAGAALAKGDQAALDMIRAADEQNGTLRTGASDTAVTNDQAARALFPLIKYDIRTGKTEMSSPAEALWQQRERIGEAGMSGMVPGSVYGGGGAIVREARMRTQTGGTRSDATEAPAPEQPTVAPPAAATEQQAPQSAQLPQGAPAETTAAPASKEGASLPETTPETKAAPVAAEGQQAAPTEGGATAPASEAPTQAETTTAGEGFKSAEEIAREIAPEAFTERDSLTTQIEEYRAQLQELGDARGAELQKQVDALKEKPVSPKNRKQRAAKIAELEAEVAAEKSTDTPEMADIRAKLQEADYRIRELATTTSAALSEGRAQVANHEALVAGLEDRMRAGQPAAVEAQSVGAATAPQVSAPATATPAQEASTSTNTVEEPTEAQPTTPTITPDTRTAFYDLIEGKTALTDNAVSKKLGISEADVRQLSLEAEKAGWLTRTDAGKLRRVHASKRPARPSGEFSPSIVGADHAAIIPANVPGEGNIGFTDEAQSRHAELQAAVDAAASRILPKSVAVRVVESIRIAGQRARDAMLALRATTANNAVGGRVDDSLIGNTDAVVRAYHGTTSDFKKFSPDKARSAHEYGTVFVTPSARLAWNWASMIGGNIIPVNVRLGKSEIIDVSSKLYDKDFQDEMVQAINESLRARGFSEEDISRSEKHTRGRISQFSDEHEREKFIRKLLLDEDGVEITDPFTVPADPAFTAAAIRIGRKNNLDTVIVRNMREGINDKNPSDQIIILKTNTLYSSITGDSMLALPGFYSPAIRAAESISMKKGTGEQFWKQITKTPGIRMDELEWMGLEEFLKGKKSVTKDEVLEFMRASVMEGQPLAMRRGASQQEALGQTDPATMTISIAMRAVEAEAKAKGVSPKQEVVRVFRHEAVEFFKATGMFKDSEWKLLQDTARKQGWVETTGVREAYSELYQEGMTDAELADLLLKEAIAEQYSEFHLGRKQFDGPIAKAFQRIKDFLTRVANFVRGMGFQKWEDVFERIDEGEFKARFEKAFPELAQQPGGDVAIGPASELAPAAGAQTLVGSQRKATSGLEKPEASLATILEKLSSAIGAPVRQGRMNDALKRMASQAGGALMGQYSRNTGVIRTAIMNDIRTRAHESAHHMETVFGAELDALKQMHAAELEPLATPGPDQVSEGFAEFVNAWLNNAPAAIKAAPKFAAAFEAFLSAKNAKLLSDLKEVQADIAAWTAAPSAGVIASSIVSERKTGILSRIGRAVRGKRLNEARRIAAEERERLVREGILDSIESKIEETYTDLTDDLHPIFLATKRLLEVASANLKGVTGKKEKLALKAVNDPYKLMRMSRGAFASGHMDLMEGVHPYQSLDPEGKSFRDILIDAFGGGDRAQWSEEKAERFGAYLISRRMVQEWKRFKAGELTRFPDKFTAAEHEQNIREMEAAHPQFAKSAVEIYAYQERLLRKTRDAGIITTDEYAELARKVDYVPAMRDMSERTTVKTKGATDPAANQKQSIIRRFQGSQRDIINPLDTIVRRTYSLEARIAWNDSVRALDALARAAGPGGGAIAERIPSHQMKKIDVNVIEALRNAMRAAGIDEADAAMLRTEVEDLLGKDNLLTSQFRPGEINELGEPIVYFWEDGKRVALRLADGQFGVEMFEAITGLGREYTNLIVDTLAIGSQVMRLGITSSPDFIVANMVRDALSAWILTSDSTPVVTQAAGLRQIVGGGKFYKLYNRVGGLMGGPATAALHKTNMQRELLDLRRKGIKFTLNPLSADFWRMTEFSETASRVGIFKNAFARAKKDGFSDWAAAQEAHFTARDYIDYNRRGSRAIVAARLVPFLNAAVQGTIRELRGLAGLDSDEKVVRDIVSPYIKSRLGQPLSVAERNRVGKAAKVWAKTAVVGLIGALLVSLYIDDDDFEEFSDYTRSTHWPVKLPGGYWVVIPKPFFLGNMSNFFERAIEYVWKKDDTAPKRFASGLYQTVVPPHSVPVVDLGYELATGHDLFTDRPIVSRKLAGLPPEMQFDGYTSTLGRWVARQLGTSPAYTDHAIAAIFSSYGRAAQRASDLYVNKGEARLTDYPFISRFIKDPKRGATSVDQFYDLMSTENGEFIRASNGYNHLLNEVRDDLAASEYLKTLSPDQRVYAIMAQFKKPDHKDFENPRMKHPSVDKALHPLNWAQDIVGVTNGIRKQVVLDQFNAGKNKDRALLSPSEKVQVDDILRDLSMRSMRNALVVLEVPGWKYRDVMDIDGVLATLKEASPQVYDEFWRRLKKEKIPSFDGMRKVWPEVRRRILDDGDQAYVHDLSGEAGRWTAP